MFFAAVDVRSVVRQQTAVTRDVVQVVGSSIRRLRLERGFTQEEFAQHARLDRSFYGRVERGTQNVALRTLCVIAAALDLHPSELLLEVTLKDCRSVKPPN